MTMKDLAWVNGEITELAEAKVSFLDHGYFYGFGVYEAFKLYDGRIFAIEDHLDRLERSMKEIRIQPDFSREELKGYIKDLMAQSGLKEAMVYLQVTRGVGPRTHSALKNPKPTLSMFISYLPPISEKLRNEGIKVVLVPDDRWAHPFIKTLNLLPNILAKQTAEEKGAFEAIFVRENGHISEAASSNVFAVLDGVVVTPPADGKILVGITRTVLLRVLENHKIPFREDYITQDQLRKAEEVFITNTGSEVLAVTDLDGQRVGNGKPGPITHKLYDLFMQEVPKYLG
jgi:D-alanine transaminase